MRKDMWVFQGVHQNGSHYQLLARAANGRHRSSQAWKRRGQRGQGTGRWAGRQRQRSNEANT